jgi:hypothetical protein
MPPSDRKKGEAYIKNTKEKYAALGRFVEAFEDMVDEVRSACMELIFRNDSSARSELRWMLLHIVFYQRVLTANPLFQIMRSMAGEIFKRLRDGGERNFDDAEFAAFSAVMKMIGREYTSLVVTRNNLLHAQWGMEFPFEDDPDGLKLFIFKGESNKDGWAPLENLPQTASELLSLSKKCQEVSHWVFLIARCFDGGDSEKKITDCFKFDDKQWYCALPVDKI